MTDEWTFEVLSTMTLANLKRIRDENREKLARLRDERFAMAAQILFYQSQIKLEENSK